MRQHSIRHNAGTAARRRTTGITSNVSPNLYAELFPLLQEKFTLLDPAGCFHITTPALISMLEVADPQGIDGHPIREFLQGEVALQFQSLLDLMKITGKDAEQLELEFVTRSGKLIPARVMVRPFLHNGVAYTHLGVEDLLEWKATQNELLTTRFELEMAYDAILSGWARTLELRDIETKGHSVRVTNIMADLSLRMGFQLEDTLHFRHGAMLHDIGKLAIPDSILLKRGPLSETEWQEMKKHPYYARQLLGSIDYLKGSLAIPYSHHEKWDGSGYPEGLKGEEIPIEARMFALADVWDALVNVRPYREAWSGVMAREYIQKNSGSHFDPAIVPVFLGIIRE